MTTNQEKLILGVKTAFDIEKAARSADYATELIIKNALLGGKSHSSMRKTDLYVAVYPVMLKAALSGRL